MKAKSSATRTEISQAPHAADSVNRAMREIESMIQDGAKPEERFAIRTAGKTRFGQASIELDDETIAAINRAEDQIDRGQGINFKKFAAKMRKKF